jgi:uncharacterized membrane protein
MTAPHQDALQRLSHELQQLSAHMAAVASRVGELQYDVAPPVAPPPPPVFVPPPAPAPPPVWVAPAPAPPRPSLTERLRASDQNWIGKLLAIAGVAVTLIGVVLLLVLAAQAGILRPEIRVTAGAVLAGGLVAIGIRLQRRPGGRVGAIALTATGVAAAYMDVLAVTTIYAWVPPVVGLLLAAVVGAGGLMLARRWDTQQLALLVLVPLIVLAPLVADGVTLLLIGFLTALSAASLPVQLGRDWTWMHAARTAAVTLPLLVALFAAAVSSEPDGTWLLGGACGVAALLAVLGTLVLLPTSTRATSMALVTAVGVLPALAAGAAVPRALAVLLALVVAVGMLAVVLLRDRLPGITDTVAAIWSALSAVAALVAVTTAFDGPVAGPILLGLALMVTLAGLHSRTAGWIGVVFAALGGLIHIAYAPPLFLVEATRMSTPEAVSTAVSSVLMLGCAVAIVWAWTRRSNVDNERARWAWFGAGVIALYEVTMLTVTVGVLIGGVGGGFLAGHMAATICWIATAAALFVAARRFRDPQRRTAPLVGGLALTAAATGKLFLFDLGTLDGMFRVAVFIVVGLVLLGMGTSYARSLAAHDETATPE